MAQRKQYPEAEAFLKSLPFPGARAHKHVKALEGLLHRIFREGFDAGDLVGSDAEDAPVETGERRKSVLGRIMKHFG